MPAIEFRVCRQPVRMAVYGASLDQEQAVLDAVDAARDAIQQGGEAQVWLQTRSRASRIL